MRLMSPSGILEFPKFTQAPKTARASNRRSRFDKERSDHAANIAFFAIYVKSFLRTVLITGLEDRFLYVCFQVQNGHDIDGPSLPLMTRSGHPAAVPPAFAATGKE